MKKLLTLQLDKIIIHHKGVDHQITQRGGTLVFSEAQISEIPEAVALILVLLSGARKFFIGKESYFAIREGIWFHLDRASGGLTETALELFEDDVAVIEAAKLNRAVFEKNPVKKTK